MCGELCQRDLLNCGRSEFDGANQPLPENCLVWVISLSLGEVRELQPVPTADGEGAWPAETGKSVGGLCCPVPSTSFEINHFISKCLCVLFALP